MQKVITAAKHIVIFIVSLLLITGFTVGIVSAIISFLPDNKMMSFFGLHKHEFIEYISELFSWAFIFTYVFKNKIPNKICFVILYWFLCVVLLFFPLLFGL